MRILITGGRSWSEYETIFDAIVDHLPFIVRESWPVVDPAGTTVVHGNARGADLLADKAARVLGLTIEVHPANWAEHHRAAGPIRNQKMVDLGADVCLAFLMPGSKGTADCIKRAEKAGIPVVVYKGE
jgi:hypothetical protein